MEDNNVGREIGDTGENELVILYLEIDLTDRDRDTRMPQGFRLADDPVDLEVRSDSGQEGDFHKAHYLIGGVLCYLVMDTVTAERTIATAKAPMQEWVVGETPREKISKHADEILAIYLGGRDAAVATGMDKVVEFAKSQKKLEELVPADIADDVALEMRLAGPEAQLNQKEVQFLRELDEFLASLEKEKWEGVVESVLLSSEKLAEKIGVDQGLIEGNTTHTKEVVSNVASFGGGRLAQLMAAGHDAVKLRPDGQSDLAGHEAKSAIFNVSVGEWLEGQLGDLGYKGETVKGAIGKLLAKSYVHRTNEFPEVKAKELGTRKMEVDVAETKVEVTVALLWGSKAVRLATKESYRLTTEEVGEEEKNWVRDQAEKTQVGDIATGLSPGSLEKYHSAYSKKGPMLSEIVVSDAGYYTKIFGSFLDNIRGALDPKAMRRYLDRPDFKQSLVIRRMMRLAGEWGSDEVLSGLLKGSAKGEVVGKVYDDLRTYREEQRALLNKPENDTDANWVNFSSTQKQKFHLFAESVRGLSEEELAAVAGAEIEQLKNDFGDKKPEWL